MKKLLCIFSLAVVAWSDTGVLIPNGLERPDPSVFSLNEMTVEIRIDNNTARVRVRQIFGSHTGSIQEGVYHFALPAEAAISDFAVLDGVTRIPGVILEKRRAGEIYEQAKSQAIDPGLLQIGERDEEANLSQLFTARIVPIPAFGTKRVETEYQLPVPVENYQSELVTPLKPDAYALQTAEHLTVVIELRSDHAIRDFQGISKAYPLQIQEQNPHFVKAVYSASKVALQEDLAIRYSFDDAQADTLRISAERESTDEAGFFQADALLRKEESRGAPGGPPKIVIFLFDNSLSMQWNKLEQSFHALETALRRLGPSDSFNVLLFNSDVNAFSPQPRSASTAAIEEALAFVRRSDIHGGTDLRRALNAGLAQFPAEKSGKPFLMLITDGGATEGTVHNGKIDNWFAEELNKKAPSSRPHLFAFGVGDDANISLLSGLASGNGVFEAVLSTEPLEFKLNAFLDKMGREPVKNIGLSALPSKNFTMIYPLGGASFGGGMASWVGQYRKPGKADFAVHGVRDGKAVQLTATAVLPAQTTGNPMLPRTWAKERVDALLEKIENQGEDRETIDEIIRLSKKYKFVTPYTSFLAAPRALLRPRVIRPGDPVLRVKTDESIVSVIALFPFGPIQPLRFLRQEQIWETRFLAPTDMADGTYSVRLVLRDRAGNVYRESKSFVIASKVPYVRVRLDKPRVQRGETLSIVAYASASARTVTARLYGSMPIALRWNAAAKADTGSLTIPSDIPAGKYVLHVVAEDMAHNIGTQEVALEIF